MTRLRHSPEIVGLTIVTAIIPTVVTYNHISIPILDDDGSTQMEDEEKAVCNRLGTIVNVFHEIIQSAVPAGACIDTTLKVVTRLYNALTLLSKYVSQCGL